MTSDPRDRDDTTETTEIDERDAFGEECNAPVEPVQHYYTEEPEVESAERTIETELRGQRYRFVTDRGVFSPTRVDPGSRVLIETMALERGWTVLDIGAGYGPVGIAAARLVGMGGRAVLVEVNKRAAALAKRNATLNHCVNVRVLQTDAFDPAEVGPVDAVVTNPPFHAGKQTVLDLLERGLQALKPGRELWMVAHKYSGAKSYEKWLTERTAGVETVAKSGGYRVLAATKRERPIDGHGGDDE